jgi:hypothetical protein
MGCQSVPELPNPMNSKLREAIEKLRELNVLSYLPMKVVGLCSK